MTEVFGIEQVPLVPQQPLVLIQIFDKELRLLAFRSCPLSPRLNREENFRGGRQLSPHVRKLPRLLRSLSSVLTFVRTN